MEVGVWCTLHTEVWKPTCRYFVPWLLWIPPGYMGFWSYMCVELIRCIHRYMECSNIWHTNRVGYPLMHVEWFNIWNKWSLYMLWGKLCICSWWCPDTTGHRAWFPMIMSNCSMQNTTLHWTWIQYNTTPCTMLLTGFWIKYEMPIPRHTALVYVGLWHDNITQNNRFVGFTAYMCWMRHTKDLV